MLYSIMVESYSRVLRESIPKVYRMRVSVTVRICGVCSLCMMLYKTFETLRYASCYYLLNSLLMLGICVKIYYMIWIYAPVTSLCPLRLQKHS